MEQDLRAPAFDPPLMTGAETTCRRQAASRPGDARGEIAEVASRGGCEVDGDGRLGDRGIEAHVTALDRGASSGGGNTDTCATGELIC